MQRIVYIVLLFFGLGGPAVAQEEEASQEKTWWEQVTESAVLKGAIKNETAYRLSSPQKWTKIKNLALLEGKFTLWPNLKVKLAGRGFYDAVFNAVDQYPRLVRKDQQDELILREAYADLSWGDLDLRAGLQQIVWGEAIGLFVTDVVNPRNLREFLLPDFDYLRIPVWAVDAQYHLGEGLVIEGVWTPDLRFGKLARPGGEFAFFRPSPPPGVRLTTERTRKPAQTLLNSNAGLRLSWLVAGWDFSLLYFYGYTDTPVFFRKVQLPPSISAPTVALFPAHRRQQTLGVTLGKALGPVVVRGEVAYIPGSFISTDDRRSSDGVLRRDEIQYLISADHTFFERIDTTFQVSHKFLQGHVDPRGQTAEGITLAFRAETGFWQIGLGAEKLVLSFLIVGNTDDGDYLLCPRMAYQLNDWVTLAVGMDLFSGRRSTFYGQFHDRDRVYFEAAFTF